MDLSVITLIISATTTVIFVLYALLKNLKHVKSCCCVCDCKNNEPETENERLENEKELIQTISDLNYKLENSPLVRRKSIN